MKKMPSIRSVVASRCGGVLGVSFIASSLPSKKQIDRDVRQHDERRPNPQVAPPAVIRRATKDELASKEPDPDQSNSARSSLYQN